LIGRNKADHYKLLAEGQAKKYPSPLRRPWTINLPGNDRRLKHSIQAFRRKTFSAIKYEFHLEDWNDFYTDDGKLSQISKVTFAPDVSVL
jgi:hypothetical protein